MKPRGRYNGYLVFMAIVGLLAAGPAYGAVSTSVYYNLRMHLLTINDTPTATATISLTPTITPTPTESATFTITRTVTPTPTPSPTVSETPTISVTPTESPVVSNTNTPTDTWTPTAVPTFTPSKTSTAVVINTSTSIPTSTPFVNENAVLAFPNPARGQLHFAYTVNGSVKTQIDVYRLTGERAATIVEHQNGGAGQTLVTSWQATGVAPGVYLCRVVITDAEGRVVLDEKKKVAIIR